MKKRIFTIIATLCLCAISSLYAGNASKVDSDWVQKIDLDYTDANVIGHVLEAKTQEHVPYVKIRIKGTTLVTATDATGHYFLKHLPEGTFEIEVSGLGYKTATRKVTFRRGKTLEENFELDYDMLSLDGVVVSSNRGESTRFTAPTLVKVIDSQIIEKVQAVSISESLNFQPGVRMEDNCQNCGFNQVRINGLSGAYSQILIDSRPVYSALAGVYALEQIPANMIERIEVVRGGGSALYGGSAIAGTINIITKEPTLNSFNLSHELKGIGGFGTFQNVTSFNSSMVSDDNRIGATVFGQIRHRSPYDDDGDGYSELPKLDSKTLGVRTFWKISPYSKLTGEYHNTYEFRRGGNNFEKEPFDSGITEQLRHNTHVGSLEYNLFSANGKHHFDVYASFMKVNRLSYYGGAGDELNRSDESVPVKDRLENLNKILAGYGNTKGLTYVFGTQYTYDMDKLLFMPAQFIAGAEYLYDDLNDISGFRTKPIDQNVNTKSAFIQNEWKNHDFSLLLGVRMDKHSLLKDPVFSPRATVRYAPIHNLAFRLNYARGFRAPQIFDEDLHVDNAGGDQIVLENAPNLKEEISNSFDFSTNFYATAGSWYFNLVLDAFYTNIEDAFQLTEAKKGDVTIKTRNNTGKAVVKGVSLDGKVAFTNRYSLEGGLTYQKSEYGEAEKWHDDDPYSTRRIYRTPDLYGYFVASATPIKNLTFSLSGNYTGDMLAGHEFVLDDGGKIPSIDGKPASILKPGRIQGPDKTAGVRTIKTPSFFEFGLKLSYEFKFVHSSTVKLYTGVSNIFNAYQDDFDLGPNRDSAYIYGPGAPRCFYTGVKIGF